MKVLVVVKPMYSILILLDKIQVSVAEVQEVYRVKMRLGKVVCGG